MTVEDGIPGEGSGGAIRGTSSPEKGGYCFCRLMKTSYEGIRGGWSTRDCARGRSHGRRRAGNHFEIDAGLGEEFGFIVSMRGWKRVVRFKPHDEMPFPGC